MTSNARLAIATLFLIACLFVSYILFGITGRITDLQAYGIGFIALVFAAGALRVLYPERARLGFRLYATFAGLLVAFWALEIFGGLAWYTLDKLARQPHK